MSRPTILERAFQLARAGASLDEIRARLRREGYEMVSEQLTGRVIVRQLRDAGATSDRRRRSPAASQTLAPSD